MDNIIHTSQTARHRKIRINMQISKSLGEHHNWIQAVTKAYFQGYELEGDVYIKPATQCQRH